MGNNPLVNDTVADTLINIENHLIFIKDYFSSKSKSDNQEDPRILYGLCDTVELTIDAIQQTTIQMTEGEGRK